MQRNTGGSVKSKFGCLLHRLPFEDVWSMFGEGVHPRFEKLFNMELAPFLSQGASNFW
jgi:betaine lipid synthase